MTRVQVRLVARGGASVRQTPPVRVRVPPQGPPGPPGPPGDGVPDVGDLTLVFENHLI